MSDWIDVAAVTAISPGDYEIVELDDIEVAVFNVDGSFYAIADICTHDGGQLTGGQIDGCKVYCPRHGACFDVRSGAALSAPAYEPVATFPTRIHAGQVQIRDARFD